MPVDQSGKGNVWTVERLIFELLDAAEGNPQKQVVVYDAPGSDYDFGYYGLELDHVDCEPGIVNIYIREGKP